MAWRTPWAAIMSEPDMQSTVAFAALRLIIVVFCAGYGLSQLQPRGNGAVGQESAGLVLHLWVGLALLAAMVWREAARPAVWMALGMLGGCSGYAAWAFANHSSHNPATQARSRALAAAVAALSVLAALDAGYWLRLGWALLTTARLSKPLQLLGRSRLWAMVLPADVDRNGHMNNARYLREAGFGRHNLWLRMHGLWQALRADGQNMVVAAQQVRYRKELPLWRWYRLESRVLCWDDKAFYIEQRFVRGGFVHAILWVKYAVIGAAPVDVVRRFNALADIAPPKNWPSKVSLKTGEVLLPAAERSPAMPAELQSWCKSLAESSAALRAESKEE